MNCIVLLVSRLLIGVSAFESQHSGTIYVVRHAETKDHVRPHGINDVGLRRAQYMTTIFDGTVFQKPASIVAARVVESEQRMIDTVAPLAEHLHITMDTSILLVDDPHWTEQPCKDAAKLAMEALKEGPVVIAWWSYIKYLCKDLGHKCPGGVTDFQGYDQVLVVEVEHGKVTSMSLENENFVDPGPSPSPSPGPSPSPSPSPSPGSTDTLLAGASLEADEHLVSAGGRARLHMQGSDGNLVLRAASGEAVWASNTSGNPGAHLVLQKGDGNLVVQKGNDALWSTGVKSGAEKLVLSDDCRFDVVDSAGRVLWSTGTSCTKEQPVSVV